MGRKKKEKKEEDKPIVEEKKDLAEQPNPPLKFRRYESIPLPEDKVQDTDLRTERDNLVIELTKYKKKIKLIKEEARHIRNRKILKACEGL